MSPLKTMNDIIKARGWDDAQKMLGQPIAAIARHIQKRLTDQMKRSQPADADSRDFFRRADLHQAAGKGIQPSVSLGQLGGGGRFPQPEPGHPGDDQRRKNADFRAADRGYVGTWKNRAGAGSTEIHGP